MVLEVLLEVVLEVVLEVLETSNGLSFDFKGLI